MTAALTIASIVDRLRQLRPPRGGQSYTPGHAQNCLGCGRSAWLVCRTTAECAFCGSALPLASSPLNGACSADATDFQGDR